MAKISLHFDPTADLGHLKLKRKALTTASSIGIRSRNAIIGLTFIGTISLLGIGLYAADKAAFNHGPAQPAALSYLPLDYD